MTVELRFFERRDFHQLMEWVDSPEFLMQWAGPSFSFPLTEKQLDDYLEDSNLDRSEKYIYSVIQKDTGKLIGHISLVHIDRYNRSGRIGRVLVGDPKARGNRVGRQMVQSVLKIAFEELHLHRVSLGVFDFNKPAITCYENLGFQKEGLLRDTALVNGSYWNLWEMSLLEGEWEQLKGEI
ncbi:GNAT family N-acetyltransferase [Virgibacillus sediminis]|uniref:GNAT family N-acetyltransferase n=1 Tax=Virgibacillus sediminis TaxID=202260 RepID=A0ABV7AAN8_9BACI